MTLDETPCPSCQEHPSVAELIGPLTPALIASIRAQLLAGEGRRWSLNWPACRDCGTDARPHASRGRCGRCQDRARRARKAAAA